VVSDKQSRDDQAAGNQAGDPGDVADPRQRISGQRADAQRHRQPRHAHQEDPGGEGTVAHPGRPGQRGHRCRQPERRSPAPGRLPGGRPGPAAVPPSDHRGAADVRHLIAHEDRDHDRDRDGEHRPPCPDQRAGQQRHGATRQQDRGDHDDLRDDARTEEGDRGGGRQRVERGGQR
jgi:hypothetical protein